LAINKPGLPVLGAGSGIGAPDLSVEKKPRGLDGDVEEARKAFTIPEIKLEMLWCPPGTFEMGSPMGEEGRSSYETLHAVTLTQGFWLGKNEVTQAQWQAVMWSNPSRFKGAALPVDMVSWNDAVSFCAKLTERERKAGRLPVGYEYQLPTESQWEYACRAGAKTAFFFGESLSSREANFDGNHPYGEASKGPALETTVAVGSYSPNAWGFHDLHGNVLEWCHDWHGAYPGERARDPLGPAQGSERVNRGGSWLSKARDLRSAARFRDGSRGRRSVLGFRPSLRLSSP